MLRSVLGRFRIVFEQAVTTSRHVTRHRKLLSRVAIVGGNIFVALEVGEDFAITLTRIYEYGEQINPTPPTRPMFTSQAVDNEAIDKSMADLVEETCSAVVSIDSSCNDLEDTCSGSGFFINKEGLILTNAHVVGNNKTVTVLTTDDRSHQGVVESVDANIDLALVRIQTTTTKEFPSIKLADSSKVRLNDFVMAIGNPLGNKNCFMTGVILNRSLTSDIIRYKVDHDASLSVSRCLFPKGIKVIRSNIIADSGTSGSPLINQNGEAVGVVFAASHNYDEERPDKRLYSTALSVPSNTAKKFLTEAKMKELQWVSLCLRQGGTSFSNFDYFLWSEGSI